MDPLQQPTPSDFAPAPASPAEVGAPGLSQEQMKGNIQNMMTGIEGKYQDFTTAKTAADTEIANQKTVTLQDLFDFFQSQGVDPNSPEEVQAYLDKLKMSNPEIYDQVESALKMLLGEDLASSEGPTVAPVEGAPVDNMNINNTNGQSTPESL